MNISFVQRGHLAPKFEESLHQFGTFGPIINSIQSFIYLEFIDCSVLSDKKSAQESEEYPLE